MRTACIDTLCDAAQTDDRIWLLCGDLGYSVLERFAQRFPERFLNVGIAEQAMTGVAAGLALAGKIVVTYSIANFPVMRCLEQLRNDVAYHRLNVKVVAVGGGLSYGSAGYSHHAVEDLAVTRVLPSMTVLAPGDPVEMELATRAMLATDGPCYLRVGKAGEPRVHTTMPDFALGRALSLRTGSDVTLISTGGVLQMTCAAADALGQRGISAGVLSLPTLAPCDEDAVLQAAALTGRIVTVEEHGEGGLGSVVAEILARAGLPARWAPVRLNREPVAISGSHSYLRATAGVSLEAIITTVEDMIEDGRPSPTCAERTCR